MSRYQESALIRKNIRDYLERVFINNGLYFNVASGEYNLDGERADILKRVDSLTYESLYDRWIYESDCSGVAPYNALVCSGVYVDGAFHAKNTSPYNLKIDYNNGRIIFASGVPSNAIVSATPSYRHVIFDYPRSNVANLLFSRGKDNADYLPYAFPSGNQRQLPCVIIDLQRSKSDPFAMGGYKKITQHVVFHILANNDDDIDIICDLLQLQFPKIIRGVNYNKIPQQFTYTGDLADTYLDYTTLQEDPTYIWLRMYIESATVRERDVFYDAKRARVDWEVGIIKGQ